MQVSDFIFQNFDGRSDTVCRVRILVNNNYDVCAVLTDVSNHIITASVTNRVEYIYETLVHDGFIPENAEIYEHYEDKYKAFELVLVSLQEPTEWRKADRKCFCKKYDIDYQKFFMPTTKNTQIMHKLSVLKRKINPYMYYPDSSDIERVKRQFEIDENFVPKSELKKLVEEGANEQKILSLIKKDLSIIAEQYSISSDEYICFSEFPIGDMGRVDFALFSGRSRMCVTLIEVKGADFPFIVNHGGYKKPASKIESAKMQVMNRNGYIYRNYPCFCKEMHEIRLRVESGESCYNSFLGPAGLLHVDPNKDIHIRYAIIGGRTVNDLEESSKRHQYEILQHPPVYLETWDSWLAKLSRK